MSRDSLYLIPLISVLFAAPLILASCDSGGSMDENPEPEPSEVEVSISGTVTSDSTGVSIEGSTISVIRSDEDEKLGEATTGSDGGYEISFTVAEKNTPDELRLTADAQRFLSSEVTVDFSSQITRDIVLEGEEIEVTIEGTVTENESGSEVEDATVTASDADSQETLAETTTEGEAYQLTFTVFAPDRPGDFVLEVMADGFEPEKTTVPFDSLVTQDFLLKVAPIEISTVDELQKIGRADGFPSDARYVLINDIDASETSTWNGGEGFAPLGNPPFDDFTGTLDGQGFEITGLTINRGTDGAIGLIGTSGNALVKDLNLSNVEVKGNSAVGAVVGQVFGGTTEIQNVQVSGDIEAVGSGSSRRGWQAGGIVGKGGSGIIRESHFQGSVSGTVFIGGLAGDDMSIEQSYATGSVSGNNHVGGLVGQLGGGEISISFADCTVSSERRRVGGLVGTIRGGEVSQSYSTSEVASSMAEDVGGLIGANESDGNGEGGVVRNSYAAGRVSGQSKIGGLIGVNGSDLDNSFWDVEITEQDVAVGEGLSGGTGLTTSEMQGESAKQNMDSFDFQNTWQTVTNDYPELQWEK